MKIALFHPSLYPPKNYGGVERVVLWLAKGLAELGVEVGVVAYPGSELPRAVSLIPVEDSSALGFVRSQQGKWDLIHFMAPPEEEVLKEVSHPYLVTVHGNGKPGEKFPKNTVFLCRDHAIRHGHQAFVYNGIDPAEYQFRKPKSASYLFLSKTSWSVKNLSGAMKICRKAKTRLSIAGGNRPLGLRIVSAFQPGFHWVGPVAGAAKAELLANARALLFPILWDEPFGLVMVEALISGTPVIANPRGSVREVLTPDVSILPASEDEWIETVMSNRVDSIEPDACRNLAMTRFHYLTMAKNYIEYYKKSMRQESF